MAIYKPSNCVPFLDAWDLTKNQNISFEVNTNNNIVNGYKIRILDSKNNLIFEGENFSKINAYNGDIIEIPLIVRIQDKSEAKEINVIYYNVISQEYCRVIANNVIPLENFSNGYINQPYKWQVILAQGVGSVIDDKYYDMTIANGTVIGSTPNRIQSALSEYIYKDYFIQLIGKDGKTLVGYRAPIISYDHTYGHITPKEGWFTQENINNASYFQIFKNTNQVEYIKTNRIVNNITKVKMGDVTYGNSKSKWEPSKDTSKYYFVQTYSNVSRTEVENSQTKEIEILISKYCDASGSFIPGQTTLLVRNESSNESGDNGLSKYNGVFLFVSANWSANQDDITKGTLTITWQRPAIADTWSDFLGQSFFVLQTSENWDSNATSFGEINETPLAFYQEKAIEIYPNNENKILGEVYKTNEPVPDKSKTYRIYVRPFIGIEDGMRFKWVKYNQDGSYRDKGFIDYNRLDTERWCIEYSSETQPDFTPNLDTYTFVSYFKTSDENPFYGYSDPEIGIVSINEENVVGETDFVVSNRIINVNGSYSQVNNKMWKSFQWSLYDFNYNIIQYDDIKYSGEISAQFVGLEKDHNYELTLTIEDELGRTFSVFKNFIVGDVIIVNPFDAISSFNCALHSVDASVAGSFGVIEEGTTKRLLLCGEDIKCSSTLLCGGLSEGSYYKNISIGEGETRVEGTLVEPTTGNITLNFETTIAGSNFIGDIIGIEFGEVKDDPLLNRDTSNDLLTVFFPDVIKYSADGLSRVNEDRYKIFVFTKIASATNNKEEHVISLYATDGQTIKDNNWLNDREVCFGYQPPDQTVNSQYDYIIVDEWFDEEDKKYYRTLNREVHNFSAKYGGVPAKALTLKGDIQFGLWYDKKLKAITQPNGVIMQVITDEDNVWSDTAVNGEDNVWSDTGYGAYEQKEILNQTGRQLLNGKTFNFNIAFENYIYKPATSTNLYAQCVVVN